LRGAARLYYVAAIEDFRESQFRAQAHRYFYIAFAAQPVILSRSTLTIGKKH